jgi:hypothetical protein
MRDAGFEAETAGRSGKLRPFKRQSMRGVDKDRVTFSNRDHWELILKRSGEATGLVMLPCERAPLYRNARAKADR